jgi:DNA-binding response OmpR family regulator
MESGKMTLQETTLSLQPFLNRVVSSFESHAERLDIQYRFDYRLPERLRITVDEDKLQKILNNLIGNALKFTAPYQGNIVLITAEASEGFVKIGVEDSGRGIYPDDIPYIFDRFFQTKQQNAPSEGGFGIGLALCKEYIQVMKGRIGVESTVGKGSLFWITFPKKEVDDAATERPLDNIADPIDLPVSAAQAVAPHTPNERPTLLLVEDNDSLRDYLQSILEDQYHLITARNGIEALNLINPAVQLVISDIMMPLMDGFQLLEHLKSADEWRHVPVIMLTARADIRDKLRALRIGVDDYLLKPFEEEELIARINNLLERQSARTAQPDIAPPPELASAISLTVSPQDVNWLESLEQLVSQSLDDSRLSADWLAHQLYTGRNAFFKKVKQLTGLTPNDYITVVRMTQARQLLETRQCSSVKEAAYSVGFRDVKYFSAQFQKHFGKIPSAYL